MTLADTLASGRRAAESLMADTVAVSYLTGSTVLDEATGRETPETAPRFTSKCKVQARNVQAREAEVGGRISTEVRLELHLPIDSPAVKVDDIAEITAVGSLSDVQLLGRRFRVISSDGKSFATARRVDVEEVIS